MYYFLNKLDLRSNFRVNLARIYIKFETLAPGDESWSNILMHAVYAATRFQKFWNDYFAAYNITLIFNIIVYKQLSFLEISPKEIN